jgi:hypothetical protein
MSKADQEKLFVVAAVTLALCLLALVAARPADAAFPGKNGKIAYHRAFDYFAKSASPGSPETKLLDDAAHLTYSPDGTRVAFTRGNEIYVANTDGSGTPRNLTTARCWTGTRRGRPTAPGSPSRGEAATTFSTSGP